MTLTQTDTAFAFQSVLGEITRLLQSRRTPEARQLALQTCKRWPQRPETWLMAAQVEKQAGDFPAMRDAAKQGVDAGKNLAARFLYVEALSYCGQNRVAIETLNALKPPVKDAAAWRRMADLYTYLLCYQNAADCIERAIKVEGNTPANLAARAGSELILGQLKKAEASIDGVIRSSPDSYELYYTRATLRRQTAEHNHINELHEVIAKASAHPGAQTPLRYALAKELDDLEQWAESFEQLKLGAQTRRQGMSYRVETDLKIIDQIIATFNEDYFTRQQEGYDKAAPIFVLGLPRSGTTLVDRILNCASSVKSLGEINDLSLAIMRMAASSTTTLERVVHSAEINVKTLGAAYCKSMDEYGQKALHLIDKTPFNSLNIGLIATALPNARIIHVRRNPMANAYGIYKTLFRLGYPWSYDLEDIGRYMVAHHRLMTHWREILGERIIEIDYESLVDTPEDASRRLYERCGLEWTQACLSFHKSNAPVSTASAVQVRRPFYQDAVAHWKNYEEQLSLLLNQFTQLTR